MEKSNTSIIEYYVEHNMVNIYDLQKITDKISDLLDEEDKVVFYIPGNKFSSQIFFTRKKLIIAQRFDGEWGGDIFLPYIDIYDHNCNFNIQRQNKFFFVKLDLMVKLNGITFYVKKSEADNFKKIMWNLFEIK